MPSRQTANVRKPGRCRLEVELLSHTPDPERLIERAARTCYDTTHRMSSSDTRAFLRRLYEAGHHSVFEHAGATFRIRGASRACSHQLVRHRLASYSQRSQRYVKETEAVYVTPPSVRRAGREAEEFYGRTMRAAWGAYLGLMSRGVPREDARYALPNACATEIVMSANFREWLHVLEQRLAPDAQWEIAESCRLVHKKLMEIAPGVFGLIQPRPRRRGAGKVSKRGQGR
jgi:thymidylate synthase (FAD)